MDHDEALTTLSPIFSASQFLGVDPDVVLNQIDPTLFLKAEVDNQKNMSPGVGGRNQPNVWAGLLDDWRQRYNWRGIRDYYTPWTPEVLREIAYRHPLIAAIINTREQAVKPFGQISQHKDSPGFRIVTKNPEYHPSKSEKKEMSELEKWFFETGRRDFEGHEEREDLLVDILSMGTRELLTLDRMPLELRRDRVGKIVDFRLMDGGMIRRVLPSGLRMQKQDIDPAAVYVRNTNMQEQEYRMKLELVPDIEKIVFVQIIQERIVAAWKREDMVFVTRQKRADNRFRGEGLSPIETSMNAVTAFLFSLQYNSSQFKTGAIPKIALAFKQGNFTRAQLFAMQDEWKANFQGPSGAWNIPILQGDVSVLDLMRSARDMEMMHYMEFMGALTCAVFSIDVAELGLRFGQNQNVMSENAGARAQFSKSRGLNDLLFTFSGAMNTMLARMGYGERYRFIFTGIDPEDQAKKDQSVTTRIRTYQTVDEIRAEYDLAPLPDEKGNVILDPIYFQAQQMAGAQAGPAEGTPGLGGEPEPSGESQPSPQEFEDMFGDIFKAKINANGMRTLLK